MLGYKSETDFVTCYSSMEHLFIHGFQQEKHVFIGKSGADLSTVRKDEKLGQKLRVSHHI